jgi:hypothetical protein
MLILQYTVDLNNSNILPQYGYDLFVVKFDANGGSAIFPASIDVKKGETLGGYFPTAYRLGYKFLGFWSAKTGGIKVTANTPINSNMTLYARYQSNNPITTTIKYNAPSSVVNAKKNKKVVKFSVSSKVLSGGKKMVFTLTKYKNVKVRSVKFSKKYKKYITVKKGKNKIIVSLKKTKSKTSFTKTVKIKVTLKNGNKKNIKFQLTRYKTYKWL